MDAGTDHMDASHEDIEEFALLLTRLKERTDRSYAALARRLDMNASTLYRYCAGEAVPLDFNTVKRFAALCAASPAEHVELHRRWILAVAARQRPRRTAARQTRAQARGRTPHATLKTAGPKSHDPTSTAASVAPASHSDPPNKAPEADEAPEAPEPTAPTAPTAPTLSLIHI